MGWRNNSRRRRSDRNDRRSAWGARASEGERKRERWEQVIDIYTGSFTPPRTPPPDHLDRRGGLTTNGMHSLLLASLSKGSGPLHVPRQSGRPKLRGDDGPGARRGLEMGRAGTRRDNPVSYRGASLARERRRLRMRVDAPAPGTVASALLPPLYRPHPRSRSGVSDAGPRPTVTDNRLNQDASRTLAAPSSRTGKGWAQTRLKINGSANLVLFAHAREYECRHLACTHLFLSRWCRQPGSKSAELQLRYTEDHP